MHKRQHQPQTITFKRALISAGILHALILAALLIRVALPSSDDSNKLVINPQSQSEPIQAVAISENDLKAEMQRLNNIEKKKRDEKLAAERRVKEAAEQARKAKEAEAQRIAKAAADKAAAAKAAAAAKVAAAKAAADKAAAAKADAAKAAAQKVAAAQAATAKAAADKLAAQTAVLNAAQQAEVLREIDRYKAMVRAQIMRYWTVSGGLQTQGATKLFVRVAPTGTVLDVKVVQSSGNEAMDRSAIAAVYKASPLPVPQDPELFRSFRELRLTLRPDSILSEG